MRKIVFLLLSIVFVFFVFSQKKVEKKPRPNMDLDTMAVGYDFSPVFTCDSILSRDSVLHLHEPPIGYFGVNFDRFKIHYDSIIKNPERPSKYDVYGKTMFGHTAVKFKGELNVNEITERIDSRYPGVRMGLVKGRYRFYEDKESQGSGSLVGSFISNWVINDSLGLMYDALDFGMDHFKNNQFRGVWKSYSSGSKHTCNWGDYRIPGSAKFDHGEHHFEPDHKDKHKGWGEYEKGHIDSVHNKAWEHEHEHWWDEQHFHSKKKH